MQRRAMAPFFSFEGHLVMKYTPEFRAQTNSQFLLVWKFCI